MCSHSRNFFKPIGFRAKSIKTRIETWNCMNKLKTSKSFRAKSIKTRIETNSKFNSDF